MWLWGVGCVRQRLGGDGWRGVAGGTGGPVGHAVVACAGGWQVFLGWRAWFNPSSAAALIPRLSEAADDLVDARRDTSAYIDRLAAEYAAEPTALAG